MSRPSDFTQEIADLICAAIAEGLSLRKVCKEAGMPSVSTVLRWQGKHPEFDAQFRAATDARMAHLFDELREVADDGSNDWITRQDGTKQVDHEHIARSRLRVDTLKWMLSKMDPKRFGDKIEATSTTESNLTVTWQNKAQEEPTSLERAKAVAFLLSRHGMKVVPYDAVILTPPAHVPEAERAGYGEHLVKMGLLAAPGKAIEIEASVADRWPERKE